jgi:Arc/MetJ-type ribon-helix-helix transcriptional regulator
MSSKHAITVRLDPEDVAALERARKDGYNASELIRRGLRLVAGRYYRDRRSPSTGLFVSTDAKLGDEDELYS